MDEVTGAQSVDAPFFFRVIQPPMPSAVTYDTYRAMRTHPTIALARALTVAPIVGSEWSVENVKDAPDEAVDLIKEDLFGIRPQIMEQALYAGIDFGWMSWEKVFDIRGNRLHLRKLKPLLHDITSIFIDKITGAFAGVENNSVTLELERTLLIPWRVEGTNWYGIPLLENARKVYDRWFQVDDGASRYDTKIAGANFIVHYPGGTTSVNGVETNNFEIAKALLNSLESSGSIAIPHSPLDYVTKLNEQTPDAWRIELLSDKSSKQPSFLVRLEYFDKLLVRALLWPERALLEGNYGTKAEASVHAGAALRNMELMDEYITRFVNWHVVDQLLALNFGQAMRGAVQLKSSPILDEKREFLQEIFLTILKDPSGAIELMDQIDGQAIQERLNVPLREVEVEN